MKLHDAIIGYYQPTRDGGYHVSNDQGVWADVATAHCAVVALIEYAARAKETK